MKVVISKYVGFCNGVNRAIAIAKSAPKPCLVLGELIHNARVNAQLEKEGIFSLSSTKTAVNSYLVAAHGISKQLFQEIGENIIDATCPNVRKSIEVARDSIGKLIIIGNKNHIEVKNVASYASSAVVLSSKEELDFFDMEKSSYYTVIGQTTISKQHFMSFVDVLKEKAERVGAKLNVIDTLCSVVESRLNELLEYSKEYPVIVVGDKESSNCNTLYKKASEKTCAFVIERAEEIGDFSSAGCFITTAASTPYEQVQELLNYFAARDKCLETVFLGEKLS